MKYPRETAIFPRNSENILEKFREMCKERRISKSWAIVSLIEKFVKGEVEL